MQEVRSEFAWIEPGSMKLVINQTGEPQWWTFAGDLFNLAAAHYFRDQGFDVIADAVVLSFRDRQIEEEDVRAVVDSFMNLTPGDVRVPINEDMIRGLKFHSCLPKELVEHMCRMRLDVNNAFQAMAHIFKQ